jgi:hypothetical protein
VYYLATDYTHTNLPKMAATVYVAIWSVYDVKQNLKLLRLSRFTKDY